MHSKPMKITDISFGKKIAGAFGVVLVLLVAISLTSYLSSRNIARLSHQADEMNRLYMLFGDKIIDHLDWLRKLEQVLMSSGTGGLQVETDDHRCKLGQWLYGQERQAAEKSFPALAPLLSRLEAPHARLHASALKWDDRFKDGNKGADALEQARRIYQDETLPALKEVRAQMESIQSVLLKQALEDQQALKTTIHAARRNTVILSVFAIAIAIGASLWMTRYVSSRVGRLAQFAETIAGGDFTASIHIDSADELGRLAQAMNQMRVRLATLLHDFVAGVVHLSSSSDELFGIASKMSDGAVNMSDSAHTVAAAAEEMSANMNSVAAASEQASTNVNMVAAAAEELTATVAEIARSSETARNISSDAVEKASQASTRVNELGTAATQISKVTEVITEISEQTNLLALNATIEAARAGDAGKGFAVVANEIKELARQTANATLDIKKEIEGIQTTTTSTVGEIKVITEVIDKVNDIVATIATAVDQQSATTQEIANNVAQASEGIQEVNTNVSQSSTVSMEIARDIAVVSQVAGDISNSSAIVSGNAGDLSQFTVKLREMVGEFKLPADLRSSQNAPATAAQAGPVADLIKWNDSYKVNVKVFDEQHKKLVGLINKLHRSMKTRSAGSTIGQILNELVNYTKTHFKAEEDAMRKHGYPGLAEQQRQHQDLIQQVAATQKKLASGNAMLSMDVMDFLKNWLIKHIQGSDKEYGPFFNSKGVA
jgi:methyl-accepting chemotaxis protein